MAHRWEFYGETFQSLFVSHGVHTKNWQYRFYVKIISNGLTLAIMSATFCIFHWQAVIVEYIIMVVWSRQGDFIYFISFLYVYPLGLFERVKEKEQSLNKHRCLLKIIYRNESQEDPSYKKCKDGCDPTKGFHRGISSLW